MPQWFCELRTTLSGTVEAATSQEAMARFNEALAGLDIQAGSIQDFRLDLSRRGYATEVAELEAKPKAKKR